MANINKFIISVITMSILDYFYLNGNKKYFNRVFTKIQGSLIVKPIPTLFTYIVMILSINYFILQRYKKLTKRVLVDSFLLGFFIYSIYDLTNLATIKNWPVKLVIMDALWGGLLYLITTYTVFKLSA